LKVDSGIWAVSAAIEIEDSLLAKDGGEARPCWGERFIEERRKVTKSEDDSLTKLTVAIEKLRKLGVRVTDGTCKGKAIGIVGGVRRPEARAVNDDDPADSPKPFVN
jgi:hypothetical protein